MVPLLPPPMKPGPKLPRFLPAVGRKRARVAFFVGCVADAMFRPTHWATLRVLQQNGCDVFIPPEQGCCGAIHFHAGDSRGAGGMADANLVAFELDRYDAIVVNHAGCGAMMKEYGLHWHDGLQPHREKFAAKVKDINEFLDELGHGSARPAGSRPWPPITTPAIWPTPKASRPPRGGFWRRFPAWNCAICRRAASVAARPARTTSAKPAMSDRLARAKDRQHLEHRRPDRAGQQCRLPAANPAAKSAAASCRCAVMHPMDLLDMSYRGVAYPAGEGG